ncbi:MAG TPA: hypothetical protein EYH54_02320, partial [Nautiliaceae bacterium]|nr:hypothetical protein [Nautiliaceae bacterium]
MLNFLRSKKEEKFFDEEKVLIEEYEKFFSLFSKIALLSYVIVSYIEEMESVINSLNNKSKEEEIELVKKRLSAVSNKITYEILTRRRSLEDLKDIHSNFLDILSQFLNFLKSVKDLNKENLENFKLELIYYKSEFKKLIEKYKRIKGNLKD